MVDRRRNSRSARQYKVLYFINSPAPEPEEREDILRYGPGAVFRNRQYIDPTSEAGFEPCTAVTALTEDGVPANYARHFPAAVPVEDFIHSGLAAPEVPLDASQLQGQAPEAGDAPQLDPFTVGRRQAPPDWARNT